MTSILMREQIRYVQHIMPVAPTPEQLADTGRMDRIDAIPADIFYLALALERKYLCVLYAKSKPRRLPPRPQPEVQERQYRNVTCMRNGKSYNCPSAWAAAKFTGTKADHVRSQCRLRAQPKRRHFKWSGWRFSWTDETCQAWKLAPAKPASARAKGRVA